MSTEIQETLSTSYISDLCALSEKLESSDIKKNDKTLSWDGNIIYYKNRKGVKNGSEYKIPIQIKGKEFDILPNGNELSYDKIQLTDIQNYYHDGGVLYIVVAVTNKREARAYAKVLFPIDLDNIIKSKGVQKTTTISLEYIETPEKLQSYCEYFIANKSRQSVSIDSEYSVNIEEFVGLSVSILPEGRSDPTEDIVRSKNKAIYGITKEGISIPLNINIALMENQGKIKVDCGSYCALLNYTKRIEQIDTIITINEFIELKIKDDTEISGKRYVNISINYSSDLNLDVVYKGAKFLINFYKYKKISINNYDLSNSEIINIIDEMNKSFIDYYNFIVKLGDMCKNIKIPLDTFTTREIINIDESKILNKLEDVLFYNAHTKIDGVNDNRGMFIQKIDEYSLMIAYEKCEDGLYKCTNYLYDDLNMLLYYKDNEDNFVRLNKWLCFDQNNLSKFIFDKNKMISDLKKLNELDSYNSSLLTQYILIYINYYDKSGNIKDLSFAHELIQILFEKCEVDKSDEINLYQIKFRKDLLNSDDIRKIRELKYDDNKLLCCSACLLLKEFDDFEIIFNKINDDEKNQYIEWPIYNLYKKYLSTDIE